MNFSRGITEQNFDMWIVLVFLRKETPEFKFMNFSFWPFLWFGLSGRLLIFHIFPAFVSAFSAFSALLICEISSDVFGCSFCAYSGAFLLAVGNWSFFAYSFSFFTCNWSFFAYGGKVHLIRPLRDCKQRSLTVSKKAPTVSKKDSPLVFAGVRGTFRIFRSFPVPEGPNLEKNQSRLNAWKFQVFAWNFQSHLKTSISLEIFNPNFVNSHKIRGLVGGSLEIFNLAWKCHSFNLAWKFQSRRAILKFFKIWAFWGIGFESLISKIRPTCFVVTGRAGRMASDGFTFSSLSLCAVALYLRKHTPTSTPLVHQLHVSTPSH